MSDQEILKIRQSIALAKNIETDTHTLETFLNEKAHLLHHTINLPENNATTSLLNFVIEYIEHAPDFLEALTNLTREAGIYKEAAIFLNIAEDYFLQPKEIDDQRVGLHALIDQAYLAHRLIEEVNDRMVMLCGCPLTPMDMTQSNLIIHSILGEKFANQLDMAVFYSIETLFDNAAIMDSESFRSYVLNLQGKEWQAAIDRWPCLAGDSSIKLKFEDTSKNHQIH